MEVCLTLPPRLELAEVPAAARRAERLGATTLHLAETVHDSFLVALLALQATTTLHIRTSMTVAFPRSPMITALAARDLSAYAPDRFELGLASQVRGNIVDRYSAPWDRPVAQLADYLAAVRSCFDAFAGNPLQHEGSHYRLTRMQPYFRPDPAPCPPLWMGAVGPAMHRLAGRVADGVVLHPTVSHPAMMQQRGWPELRAGMARRELGTRPLVIANPMAVTGAGDLTDRSEQVRSEFSFLLSTPAYRGVLDLLGESDRADALQQAAAQRDWARVRDLLDRTLLDRLVPIVSLDELSAALAQRWGGLADGLVLQFPEPADDAAFAAVVEEVAALPTSLRA